MLITLPNKFRNRHTYMIGKTQSGKTTLNIQMLRQDILRGTGSTIFIDPHGDAAEMLLRFIPPDLVDDVTYFEPTTVPVGFDPLIAETDLERFFIADDLIALIKESSDSSYFGPRMDAMVRYTIHTLFALPQRNFLQIYDLLSSESFRRHALSHVRDERVRRYWTEEFETYPPGAAEPILSRLTKFVLSEALRTAVTGTLDLNRIMNERKVLIVNLARVGKEPASVLGSLLMSLISIAVFRRARIPKEERTTVNLYVDEFQNFASPAFARLLGESAKFGLRLTLSHQTTTLIDGPTLGAILGNAATHIAFTLGPDDASKVGGYFRPFTREALEDLPPFHAVVRAGNAPAVLFRTFGIPPVPPGCADEIKRRTAAVHGRHARPKSTYGGSLGDGAADAVRDDPQPTRRRIA